MAEQRELWPAQIYDEVLRGRSLPLTRSMLAGESFSSWFIRMADAHGMSVQLLGSWLMGRGRQVFGEDVDRGAWRLMLETVSIAAGQPLSSLLGGTLRSYEGVLWGELPRQGTARWVLPIIKRGALRDGFGVQYCSECLATDETPHLRLEWRLAFCVACPVHRCLLLDRCDRCEAPVAAHRWRTGSLRELGSSGIVRCQACGVDRRRSRPQPASSAIVSAQARLTDALENGQAAVEGQPVNCLSFFAGAAMIWSLLDDPRDAQAVWDELDLEVPPFVQATEDRYGSFERRGVSERAVLLDGFERLLGRGVDEFVRGLSLRQLPSRSLFRYSTSLRAPAPFWYWKIVRDHLDRTIYTPSNGELDEAIRHQLRIDGGSFARASEVCRLLGMATSSSARVGRRMRELGVPCYRASSPRRPHESSAASSLAGDANPRLVAATAGACPGSMSGSPVDSIRLSSSR